MPQRSTPTSITRAAVSVSEMARMVGLSRGHFYALVKSNVFPPPVHCTKTRRPLYLADDQQICLHVKATSIGVDGQYVLFYRQRESGPDNPPPRSNSNRRSNGGASQYSELVAGLRSLGLASITDSQVGTAIQACYPSGTNGIDEGQVLRTLWQHLRRPNAA